MRLWREEETWDPELALQVDVKPATVRTPEEREEAGRLLGELMAMPVPERLDRIEDEERFHSLVLYEVLLEQGHSALTRDAVYAGELLELAIELGLWLDGQGDFDGPDARETLMRGLCLLGTADRLLGKELEAEEKLVRAGGLAKEGLAQGFFARSLALLRWDQGRYEEAVALLSHGVRRFAEVGAAKEQGSCNALLGLLSMEEEETMQSAVYLRQARRALEGSAGLDPWLAAQSTLGWALYLARRGEIDHARAIRKEAWQHYRDVKNEDALVAIYWLEGKVAFASEDAEDGLSLLDSVRQKHIQSRWLTEATLASLDLGLALAREGKAGELKRLAGEITGFQGSTGYGIARRTLDLFAEEAEADPLKAEIWAASGPALRHAFRLAGVRPRPVPFA